jgi:hypothetical protein
MSVCVVGDYHYTLHFSNLILALIQKEDTRIRS